jgi:transcription elongation factor Elf1
VAHIGQLAQLKCAICPAALFFVTFQGNRAVAQYWLTAQFFQHGAVAQWPSAIFKYFFYYYYLMKPRCIPSTRDPDYLKKYRATHKEHYKMLQKEYHKGFNCVHCGMHFKLKRELASHLFLQCENPEYAAQQEHKKQQIKRNIELIIKLKDAGSKSIDAKRRTYAYYRLYKLGVSVKEISEHTGISVQSINTSIGQRFRDICAVDLDCNFKKFF